MKDTKGPALNKRVGAIFERAGFHSMPNSNSTAEKEITLNKKIRPLDLHATDAGLGVTIIASNKAGAINGGLSAHLNDLDALKVKANADAAILVLTGIALSKADIEAVAAANVTLWTNKELQYYEALIDAIKDYAKFEIVNSLGITTQEDKVIHSTLALRIAQPSPTSPVELFMFSMTPEKLLRTCAIFRRANGNAAAYQRMVTKKRLPGIRQFVSRDDAILPTNIVVSLDSDAVNISNISLPKNHKTDSGHNIQLSTTTQQLVTMAIPLAYGSMEVLDGQHRLFGFAETDLATRKSFSLAVVGVRGLEQAQKTETFVAINDNSRRMDPNLVAYLQYEQDNYICQKDSKLMAIRVAVDLTERHPFVDGIRLLDLGKQVVTLKGFSGYDLKGLVSSKGHLRKAFPTNLPSDYTSYLAHYFSLVKKIFKTEWKEPGTYVLATNRGITALLKLLKSILKNVNFSDDPVTAEKYIKALVGFDWNSNNLKKSYVGSQGWKQFHLDLVAQIQKKYPKFEA